MGKRRILIVGATGNLGFHIAKASLDAGHPTFALVRDSAFSLPHKFHKLQSLSNAGATLLKVLLYLYPSIFVSHDALNRPSSVVQIPVSRVHCKTS